MTTKLKDVIQDDTRGISVQTEMNSSVTQTGDASLTVQTGMFSKAKQTKQRSIVFQTDGYSISEQVNNSIYIGIGNSNVFSAGTRSLIIIVDPLKVKSYTARIGVTKDSRGLVMRANKNYVFLYDKFYECLLIGNEKYVIFETVSYGKNKHHHMTRSINNLMMEKYITINQINKTFEILT